jgi:hypothetical protein
MRACPACRSTVLAPLEFCPLDGAPLYETDVDPLIGHRIGRYQVEDLLGRGAMGSVYRCRPASLERDFAVKVLHADMAVDRKLVERFTREADALSRIRHSHIVSVVDFVTTPEGLCALVMEYLPGVDLAEVLHYDGPLPLDRLRALARGVALGLQEAHEKHLIHRDVKPSNVRIVREGAVEIPKLVDFGIVRLDDQDPDAQQLTGQNHLMGTPRYMAPEMVLGGQVTPAVDLYALGVMMFEMATGAPPFVGQTAADVLVKQATEAPPPLPPLEGLEGLITALLAKDPAQRPPSAEAVVRWIDAPPPPPAPPRRRRWPWVTAALAGGAAAAALLVLARAPEAPPAAAGARPPPAPVEAAPPAVEAPPPEPPAVAAVVTPPAPPRAPAGGQLEELERALASALAERGLTHGDLAGLPETKRHYREWRRARAKKQPARAAQALQALLPDIRRARLEPRILEARLDRLMQSMRGARREVPPVLLEEVERGYFELRVQAREASTDARFASVAKRIGMLEAKLRRYVYGD